MPTENAKPEEVALAAYARADAMYDCLASIGNTCDVAAKAVEEQDDTLLGYAIMRMVDRIEKLMLIRQGK